MARPIRARGKRNKKEAPDLNVTSLLDILTMLLFFLIMHYNSTNVVVNVPKEITLPKSVSQMTNNPGVIVQVSPSKIWVDDKVILDTENLPENSYDQGGRRIVALFDALVAKKEEIVNITKSVPDAPKFSGVVNLVVDKSLKYSYIKKLLYTSAEAGFVKYKFIVMGEEQ